MKILSFDTETSIGKTIHGPTFRDPQNDIYTQIWAMHEEWVGVCHNPGGWGRKLYKSVADELWDTDLVIGHNIGFDLSYIWEDKDFQNYLVKGGKIWDTQVAEYLLTGQQHQFSSLAELQLKYLGEKEKPSRIGLLYKKGIGADIILRKKDRCPRLFALYEHYCKTDGITPIKIYNRQLERAKKLGMLPLIELYQDYLLTLINMTVSGIKVDIIKCEKTFREYMEQHLKALVESRDILKQFWKDPRLPEFMINSVVHKSAVIFGGKIKVVERQHVGTFKNGNPLYKNVEAFVTIKGFGVPTSISVQSRKEGVYSTDDRVMQIIEQRTKNPNLKRYCQLQKDSMMYKKAATTYCKAFIDRSVNGFLHPNFNNTATATGRLSSSSPNLQNVSKRNKFGKDLHSLFIAPSGWKCVQIDFSQLEIWVLAMLSGDELLVKHLLGGIDLHTVRLGYYNEDKTYEDLYKLCKVDKDPYWDKQRTFAKTVSYQMAYGAMPKKVAESTGLDLGIVEKIFEKERETYLSAAVFGDTVRDALMQNVQYSKDIDIPANQKKGMHGSRIENGYELLPIFDKTGIPLYNPEHKRMVGYYTSPTGKRYHFLNTGKMFRGELKASFSFTQPKNYPMQGTAADIQAITTVALLKALVTKQDRIKMINEVHDSKWFYVREDVLVPCLAWLKDVIEDVPKLMGERFGLNIPFKFPVDIEVGDNFGSMEKFN